MTNKPPAPLPLDHADAVDRRHRFRQVSYRDQSWDLAHLDPFVFHQNLRDQSTVTILVIFSCHCFSKAVADDGSTPVDERFVDDWEVRHLCPDRYALSTKLPAILAGLPQRRIQIAPSGGGSNFFTVEGVTESGAAICYAVFFEVERDRRRARRLILRVQSAYPMGSLGTQLRQAQKVRFEILVQRIYDGRPF